MLTMIILFILFIGAYSGYQKGLLISLFQAIGYTLSLIIAMNYYKRLSQFISLIIPYPSPYSPNSNPFHYYKMDYIFSLDRSYYYLLSLFLILFGGWLLTRFISQLLSYFFEEIIVPDQISGIVGAVVGFTVHYLTVFLLLSIVSTIPYESVQKQLADSSIANQMIISSPIVSARMYERFIQQAHEEEIENQPLIDREEIIIQEESTAE